MDPKKEQWKEEIMGSLADMQPADPNPFLLAKIKRKLHESSKDGNVVILSGPQLLAALAGIVFLISLNIFALSQTQTQETRVASNETDATYSIAFQDKLNIYGDEAAFTY